MATTDNFLRGGDLSLKLQPSSESLAGSAVACCALLTSSDEGLPARMYDVEHVESLGQDVVLVAVPMITSRPYTSSSGTAFPGYPVLGALLVAMDRDSATHPRVLTDVCCLAETLAPLVEQHTRHSVGLLQDFVLNGSSMGSTITAEHIASAERRSEQSSDNGSPAYVRRQRASDVEREDSWLVRPAGLSQQAPDMSSHAIARLHSQVRQPGQQPAGAAGPPGRPKTPVQYVRPPAGPLTPLPNPFAGVFESMQANPAEAAAPAPPAGDGRHVQLSMPPQGRPSPEPQPSAAQQKKYARAKRLELLLGDDEPEAPSSSAEQSAPSAAQQSDKQPKMALRFQMMIDSQELEVKRQQSSASTSPTMASGRPSQSAAVFPAGAPRQATMRQGHSSLPRPQQQLSSLAPARQPGRKPKSWELLLDAEDTPAGSQMAPAASQPAAGELHLQDSSGQESAEQQAEAGQPSVGTSAGDQLEIIARWERVLDKRAAQNSSAVGASGGHAPARLPCSSQASQDLASAFVPTPIGSGAQPTLLSGSQSIHRGGQENSSQDSGAQLMARLGSRSLPRISEDSGPQSSSRLLEEGWRDMEHNTESGFGVEQLQDASGVDHWVSDDGEGDYMPGSSATKQHPLWLTFKESGLEQEFAWWHTVQMQKVDKLAILFAILIFLYLGLCRPHRLAFAAPLFYCVVMAVMAVYFWLAWTQHPSYMLHRSMLLKGFVLLYIVFNTQVAFPRVLKGMADGSACTTPFVLRYINAQPLLTSCLTTMIRISGHVPLQCMFVALSWRLPRVLCPICFADQAPWKCLLRMHAQQLLVGFLVPTALMFLIEQRMRATFLRSRQQKQSKRA